MALHSEARPLEAYEAQAQLGHLVPVRQNEQATFEMRAALLHPDPDLLRLALGPRDRPQCSSQRGWHSGVTGQNKAPPPSTRVSLLALELSGCGGGVVWGQRATWPLGWMLWRFRVTLAAQEVSQGRRW